MKFIKRLSLALLASQFLAAQAFALSGNEVLQVQGVAQNGQLSGQTFQTTTAAIAALSRSSSNTNVITALTTVGSGTLTAAAISGRIVQRTGPVSAFTDTTDTGPNIIATLASAAPIGTSFQFTYQNLSSYTATIAQGSGVTLTGEKTVPANGFVRYLLTYTGVGTVTMASFENGSFTADSTDTTKVLAFNASGQTTGTQATLTTTNTANATYTLPAATDTLAGLATSQTFSGTDTFSGALTTTGTIPTQGVVFSTALGGNPFGLITKGNILVASANTAPGQTVINGSTGRIIYPISVNMEGVGGSTAGCTGVKLVCTPSTFLAGTFVAANLASGLPTGLFTANNIPGNANGGGCQSGDSLVVSAYGAACTTASSFNYMISYTVQ